MKAARITPMDFLVRFHGLMSRDDSRENLTELVRKKTHVNVGFENFECDPFVTPGEFTLGVRQIFMGKFDVPVYIPVLGMTASGNWETPVYMFLYLDDALQFQVYVPEKGNTYNWNTNTAFGNDEDEDNEFLRSQMTGNGRDANDFDNFDPDDLIAEMEDVLQMENEFRVDIQVVALRNLNDFLGG